MRPAEVRGLETDTQAWQLLFVQGSLSERLRAYFEVQPRISNDVSRADRVLVRPALGYQISKQSTVWLGYLWNPSLQGSRLDEHRAWQQLTHETPLSSVALINRTRLEQRFLPGTEEPAVRLRHMVRALVPLTDDAVWSVAVWNEFFLNLTKSHASPAAGFDQNRFFAGPSLKPAAWLRVEPGYLANLINNPGSDRLNHTFFIMTALGF